MQHHPRYLVLIPLFVALVATLTGGCADESKPGDTEFDTAFRQSDLPWYDSAAGDLASSPAPSRPKDSTVVDRNRIPPLTPEVGRPVKRQPNFAGGGPGPATASSAGNVVIYILGGIFAAVIIGLLLYGFFKLESFDNEDANSSKGRRKIRDHIKHLPFEIEEQEGDFETFAEKSLREGNYNNAVIYLFADVLVAMNESEVVRLRRGKTNRQYLNDIWDYNAIKPYYRKVMIAFEDAFFGKHQIAKERAEDCFAGRNSFDAELEKIRAAKFSAQNQSPSIAAPVLEVKTTG